MCPGGNWSSNSMGKDKDDEAIVRTIIVMAHNLKLKVVAEGVETEQQYEFVKHHGCDVVQGFFYAIPMPADAFHRWCEAQDEPQGFEHLSMIVPIDRKR